MRGVRLILRSIAHGFRNLLNLDGRDRRRTFWLYALAVLLLELCLLACWAAWLAARFDDLEAGQLHDIRELVVPMGLAMIAIYLLGILLIFAACVRRLHDSGAGMWAAAVVLGSAAMTLMLFVPVPLLIGFDQIERMPAALADIYFVSFCGFGLVSNLGTFWLLWLLLRKGTPGVNRYGPPPQEIPAAR